MQSHAILSYPIASKHCNLYLFWNLSSGKAGSRSRLSLRSSLPETCWWSAYASDPMRYSAVQYLRTVFRQSHQNRMWGVVELCEIGIWFGAGIMAWGAVLCQNPSIWNQLRNNNNCFAPNIEIEQGTRLPEVGEVPTGPVLYKYRLLELLLLLLW